ncbi:hypothetical protein SCALM49S_03696 [Streptomyces californicus]
MRGRSAGRGSGSPWSCRPRTLRPAGGALGAGRRDAGARPLLLAGLLAAAAVLAITGWTLPGRRLVPYWGARSICSSFAIVLVPLALLVTGLYGYLRGLNS